MSSTAFWKRSSEVIPRVMIADRRTRFTHRNRKPSRVRCDVMRFDARETGLTSGPKRSTRRKSIASRCDPSPRYPGAVEMEDGMTPDLETEAASLFEDQRAHDLTEFEPDPEGHEGMSGPPEPTRDDIDDPQWIVWADAVGESIWAAMELRLCGSGF